MNSKNNSFDFNSTNLLLFLWHWRITLIIVIGLAVVSSAIFSSSWFITPKYKSSVIMFPVSTNSISKALLASNTNNTQDIMEFGAEEQAEQMLQILYSSKIKKRIIDKFDLFNHYGIELDSKTKMTDLYREYEENITYKRTEFMAVEVTVMDKDPEKAAAIANEISNLVDTVKNEIQKERAIEGCKIVEEEYKHMMAEMKKTSDSLNLIRSLGITSYEAQTDRYNQEYAKAITNGNTQGAARIKEKIDILSQYGGAFVSLNDLLNNQAQQLAELKTKYNEAKVDAERNLPQKFMVDRAYKAEKKSYPVRWLIVVISSFCAFILAILTIIAIQTIRTYKTESLDKKETTAELS